MVWCGRVSCDCRRFCAGVAGGCAVDLVGSRRLFGRTADKWVWLHAHEIFFRDTAHGFLAWSLASLAGALLFASATASTVSGVARGATEAAAAINNAQDTGNALAYFTDTLFRPANPGDESNAGQSRTEAARRASGAGAGGCDISGSTGRRANGSWPSRSPATSGGG
jgi:hypothetical protein